MGIKLEIIRQRLCCHLLYISIVRIVRKMQLIFKLHKKFERDAIIFKVCNHLLLFIEFG